MDPSRYPTPRNRSVNDGDGFVSPTSATEETGSDRGSIADRMANFEFEITGEVEVIEGFEDI